MQNNIERAKLFHPFAALKGYDEALRQIEKIVEEKKELSDDDKDILDIKLTNIKIGDIVIIKYYYGLEYIETMGPLRKIDNIHKQIQVLDSKISFDDISDISVV